VKALGSRAHAAGEVGPRRSIRPESARAGEEDGKTSAGCELQTRRGKSLGDEEIVTPLARRMNCGGVD